MKKIIVKSGMSSFISATNANGRKCVWDIDPILDPLGIESEPESNLDPSGLCHEKIWTLNKLSKKTKKRKKPGTPHGQHISFVL
jgi:hypothetical protein